MDTHDGVSKLWILRARNGLDVEGHKSEVEAIGSLIRHALSFSKDENIRAQIEGAVAKALTHLDEEEEEAPEEDGDE